MQSTANAINAELLVSDTNRNLLPYGTDFIRRFMSSNKVVVVSGFGPCIAEARLNGKHFGRPLTAAKKAGQMRKLYRAGVSKAEIARQLNIGRTSVRRILSTKQP